MNDSVIIYDEATEPYEEEIKPIPTNFNEKKSTFKKKNLILLPFLLITKALLIAVTIYYYMIKYGAKKKHLFPFQFTNNKLEENTY